MTRFVLRRVISGFITLFVFVTLLFFLLNVTIPGDFTSQFILTADQRSSFQEQLGLDRTLWEQYWAWLTALATLDFGVSFTGVGVADAIRSALAQTLLILVAGVGIAFAVGSWLGRVTTWTDRRGVKTPVTFLAIVCLTAFPPALAFLFERALLNAVGRARARDIRTIDVERWTATDALPSTVLWRMLGIMSVLLLLTGALRWVLANHRRRIPVSVVFLLVVSGSWIIWRMLGIDGLAFDLAAAVSLLTLGVIVLTFGEVVLITRATMEDAVEEDYVMAARAKGLPSRMVRDRHAGRAALLPTLSRFVVAIPYFLTGLVILESVFHIGGMGTLLFEALRLQDTPLIAGALVVVGAVTVVLRIALDIAHAVLDPRQRTMLRSGHDG